MDKLFLTVLKMSITSSYVILFVMIARILLKKSPKIFSYMLWSVVLFRLVCPISFESKLSLIPNTTISEEVLTLKNPVNNINDYTFYNVPSYLMDEEGNVVDVMGDDTAINNTEEAINIFNFTSIASFIWVVSILIMISYSTFSIIKLKKRLKDSKHINDNIYESKNINTAFVIGIFNPKIYIPQGISKNEEQHIVAHERIHLKRYDYLIKLVAYIALCIHWFNPLVWISFMLMSKDMEMSCDEAVIKEMGSGIKKEYSKSLVSFATNNRSIAITPTAFGEGDVKSRIKNILNYKKASFWVVLLSIIIVISVSVGVLGNPVSNKEIEAYLNSDNALNNIAKEDEVIIRSVGNGGNVWSGSAFIENFKKQINDIEPQEIELKSDLSASLIVYIYNNSAYTLSFYEDRPEIMKITYDGQSKYYTYSKNVYDQVRFIAALSSYSIPEEVMIAVMDGKKTNKTSYEDRPLGVDYLKLTVGDSISFIYEDKGKYYVEEPYFAIYEISEQVYKDALEYASEPENFQESSKESTMPVSGKNINGLADKIINNYLNYDDLIEL